jgi:hypothetical protein
LLTAGSELFTKEGDIHKPITARKVIHNFGKLLTNCIDLLTKMSKKSTLQLFPEWK